MGLYKPESQYMSPNNITTNAGDVINFTSQVNGDFCDGYIIHIQNTLSSLSGEISKDIDLDKLIWLKETLYNTDLLSIPMDINWFNKNENKLNLNMPLSWDVTQFGRKRLVTKVDNVTNPYETIDKAVQDKIDILKKDNTKIQADIDTYRLEAGRQVDRLNVKILEVEADTSLTEAERAAKLKTLRQQIASIQADLALFVQQKEDNIIANNAKIVELEKSLNITVMITESVVTIKNGNLSTGDWVYLDMYSDTKKNYMYIRLLDDGRWKLYDTREKALAGVISTEYQAILFVESIVNKNIMPISKSDYIPFKVINPGMFRIEDLSIVDKFFYIFKPIYQQENEIPINRYQCFLYNKQMELIKESQVIYSSKVEYYIDNLLSEEPYNTYYIRFIAYSDVEYFYDTGIVEFNVFYPMFNLEAPVYVTNNCYDSTVTIDFEYLVSVPGFLECYEYVRDFIWDNNNALYICPNNTLKYEFPEINTESSDGVIRSHLPIFIWQPQSLDWTGDIYKNYYDKNTDQYVTVSYDGEAISLTINGNKIRTQWFKIEDDVVTGDIFVYLIAVYNHTTAIHKFIKHKIPEPPKILTVGVSNIEATRVSVKVVAESQNEIVEYVYFINDREYMRSSNSFVVLESLNAVTRYELYVEVYDEFGNFSKSENVSFITGNARPIITNVSITKTYRNSMNFYVNAVVDLPVYRYKMKYRPVSEQSYTLLIQDNPEFKLNNLVYGTKYIAEFQIYDVGTNESDIYELKFTPAEGLLQLIDVLLTNKTTHSVDVDVDFISEYGLKKILYYVDTNEIDVNLQNPYTINGLESNLLHRLSIKLIDLKDNVVESWLVKFSTLAEPPTIESVDIVTVTNNSVTIMVKATGDSGINRYEVIKNG